MSTIEIKSNEKEVLDALNGRIAVALEKVGLIAERNAKLACPVDTGRLRNSISHTHNENTAYIGTNVEYAPYVEMGTVNTDAQPYLKPAIMDHIEEYKNIIKQELE